MERALLARLQYNDAAIRYMKAKGAPEVQDIEPEDTFFYTAFFALRGSRSIGMAMGAIPFSEIMGYADYAGIDCPVMRSRLLRMVIHLDNVEREFYGNAKS